METIKTKRNRKRTMRKEYLMVSLIFSEGFKPLFFYIIFE